MHQPEQPGQGGTGRPYVVLAVDDRPTNLELLEQMLSLEGYRVVPAENGIAALEVAAAVEPDIILLDVDMPDLDGIETCKRLKSDPRFRDVPVVFLSGLAETLNKTRAFAAGGVDYITKPFEIAELYARVATHVRIKELQRRLERSNEKLSELVQEQVREISDSQMAALVALASLTETRDDITGNHIRRVQEYCRSLAARLSSEPDFSELIDEVYVETIYQASILHDIGKVAIPDEILLKPGPLDPSEFEAMKVHTMMGARALERARFRYPNNGFINMGIEIARSHHERWDGSGYPDGLAGEAIPVAARIVAVADVYDALRSHRSYKAALGHQESCRILIEGDSRTRPEHFDPRLLRAFEDISSRFEEIKCLFDDE